MTSFRNFFIAFNEKLSGIKTVYLFWIVLVFSFFMKTKYMIFHNFESIAVKTSILLILYILLYKRFIIKKIWLSKDEVIVLLFCFIGIISSMLLSRHFSYKNISVLKEFAVVYLGIVFLVRDDEFNDKWLKQTLYLFAFLFTVHNITAFSIWIISRNFSDGIIGLFNNSNNFGFLAMASCLLFTALLVHCIIYNNTKAFKYYFLSLFFSIIVLFLSFSRASILGYISYVIILAGLAFTRGLKIKFSRKLIYSISISLFVFIAILFIEMKFHLLNEIKKDGIFTGPRFTFWKIFINNEMNTFPSFYSFFGEGFSRVSINPVNPGWNMHNIFLEIIGRNGLIGLFLFFYFLIYVIKKIMVEKQLWIFSPMIFAFITNAMFESQIVYTNTNTAAIFFMFSIILPLHYKKLKKSTI